MMKLMFGSVAKMRVFGEVALPKTKPSSNSSSGGSTFLSDLFVFMSFTE